MSQASAIDPDPETTAGELVLEDDPPVTGVVVLVKVPVAAAATVSAVAEGPVAVSHLAWRGAAWTAAAMKARVETALVNNILTDV